MIKTTETALHRVQISETDQRMAEDLKAQEEKLFQEKKWLAWLLRIWDENGRMPNWVTIKRQWPEEYKIILTVFGNWGNAEAKLRELYSMRESGERERLAAEQRRLDLARRGVEYSLEDYLLGLIKIQEHLQIQRAPSQSELTKYENELGIPSSSAYGKKLMKRENWLFYVERYKRATPETKAAILENIELELRRQKMTKREGRDLALKPGVTAYTKDECLRMLCRVQERLEIATVPTGPQIESVHKELNIPCEKTFRTILGPHYNWAADLADYKERERINDFLKTYNSFSTGTELKLDRIAQRMIDTMTEGERLEWTTLTERMKTATKTAPAKCTIRLEGRDYQVLIQPMG